MELATLHLDTYKVVKLLQEKGYSEEEAEGFIAAIQEITLSGVATKQDVKDIRAEIQDVRNEVQDVEKGLRKEIQDIKNEMLKFQVIQTIAIIGVMIALSQIFS